MGQIMCVMLCKCQPIAVCNCSFINFKYRKVHIYSISRVSVVLPKQASLRIEATSGKLCNGKILPTCSNGNYLDLSCMSEISVFQRPDVQTWMALTPS